MREVIVRALEEGMAARSDLKKDVAGILKASEIIVAAFQAGNKVLAAGNGGSAADAQHFTAEFEGIFRIERPPLPAICLSANSSTLTAWSNDSSFDTVFERQVEAHGKAGDVFVGISTSGGSFTEPHSRNVVLAARRAKQMGLKVVGLSGRQGGALKDVADVCIVVNSNDTARIQECHITLLHILAELVDYAMFGAASRECPTTEVRR